MHALTSFATPATANFETSWPPLSEIHDLHIIPLDDPRASCDLFGGKAASLATLMRHGLPIPEGLVITTLAYDRYSGASERGASLWRHLDALWSPRCARSAAVRSSCVGEDGAQQSFAGQFLTCLGVQGGASLRAAVKACWVSGGAESPLSYSAHLGAPTAQPMAVLVQTMVDAEISGVVFTSDPVTERRDRWVVEATRGCGDALVGGRCAPQRWVVQEVGGREPVWVNASERVGTLTLPAPLRAELLAWVRRAQEALGPELDIEWCWDGTRVFILQARPITTLYPGVSGRVPANAWLLSYAALQGMARPISPLGRDTLRAVFARVLGNALPLGEEAAGGKMVDVGERLFVDITGALASLGGRSAVFALLDAAEPQTGALLRANLPRRPRRGAPGPRPSVAELLRSARAGAAFLWRVALCALRPGWSRRRAIAQTHADLEGLSRAQRRASNAKALFETWRSACHLISDRLLPRWLPFVLVGTAASRLGMGLSSWLGERGYFDREARARGLSVTTQMVQAITQLAPLLPGRAAGGDADPEDADALVAAWRAGRAPVEMGSALEDFLARYGARAEGEIDIGAPRWSDAPQRVVAMALAQRHLAAPGEDEIPSTPASASGRARRWRRWLLRPLAQLVGVIGSERERPKFEAVRILAVGRAALRALGALLVDQGALTCPDDVFLCRAKELSDYIETGVAPWTPATLAERGRLLKGEETRQRIPRLLRGEGTAYYEPALGGGGGVRGVGASPGVAEGTVRVMAQPSDGPLNPGDILVCRGLDPSWTPLFTIAGGVIAELGGVMSHGSVVGRELGLPMVVGAPRATQYLTTGARVRLDGATGAIELL